MNVGRLLVAAILVMALVGCGGSSDDGGTSIVDSVEEGSYMSAEQEKAYDLARQVCSTLGSRAIAKTYGGGSSEIDIALAYTSTVFSSTAGSAATDGCLDGFDE